jgi:hypothetical protein
MTFTNICAAAFLVATVAPAMAYNGYPSESTYASSESSYTEAFRGPHPLRAQDAIREGYGNFYPKFHSGWGGLYGDGNYPGSIDDNMGPPYRSRW